jgi:acetyl-CoA carboxylase alpha subunit
MFIEKSTEVLETSIKKREREIEETKVTIQNEKKRLKELIELQKDEKRQLWSKKLSKNAQLEVCSLCRCAEVQYTCHYCKQKCCVSCSHYIDFYDDDEIFRAAEACSDCYDKGRYHHAEDWY